MPQHRRQSLRRLPESLVHAEVLREFLEEIRAASRRQIQSRVDRAQVDRLVGSRCIHVGPDGVFAEHRPQGAIRRFLAPLQSPTVRGHHALAEIPLPLEREKLLDRGVPDLQRTAEGVFLHLVQRLPFPRRVSNRRLQSFRQFDQRIALDFLPRISHAHCAASMPG